LLNSLVVHLEEDDGGGGNILFDPVEHEDDDSYATLDLNEHDDEDGNGGFDLNEPGVHDEHVNGTTSFSSIDVQIGWSSFVVEIFMIYFL
jgi:hypothetical protein